MRIGKMKFNRRAVSPVIATLLMIAIAVAASILVYVWSMGLIGTLQAGGGEQTKEQLIMEAYAWPDDGDDDLTLYLRNVGSQTVVTDRLYINDDDGDIQSDATTVSFTPNEQNSVVFTLATGDFTPGVSYTVKVVTASGAIFTFSVIRGRAA